MVNKVKRKHNVSLTLQQVLIDIDYYRREAELLHADKKLLNEISRVEKRLTRSNYTSSRVNDILKQEIPKIQTIKKKVANLNKDLERKIFIGMLASFSPKMLLYFSGYIMSVPHNLFEENKSLYISIGITMLIIWSIIFYYLYKVYVYLDKKYVTPYVMKYPKKERRTRFFMISLFLFTCSQPLFISVETMRQIVNPSWSNFFITIYNLFINLFTGSLLASICTVITITPIIILVYKKIETKIKSSNF